MQEADGKTDEIALQPLFAEEWSPIMPGCVVTDFVKLALCGFVEVIYL